MCILGTGLCAVVAPTSFLISEISSHMFSLNDKNCFVEFYVEATSAQSNDKMDLKHYHVIIISWTEVSVYPILECVTSFREKTKKPFVLLGVGLNTTTKALVVVYIDLFLCNSNIQ